METITITNNQVIASVPEGASASMELEVLIRKLAPPPMDTGDIVLPDGVKSMITGGRLVVLVHQTEPRVFSFKWIAPNSRAGYGPNAKYRVVRIAQPYVIVLAVFGLGPDGQPCLTGANECFYRVSPLKSLDDQLLYPALLNCSKFEEEEGHPLSWICTQNLDQASLVAIQNVNERVRASMSALLRLLFETGFNYSSEHHEGTSWFTESRRVDDRVSSIEKWEAATAENSLFALEVPWLPTGRTVRQVVERILKNQHACRRSVTSASDLVRIVFNGEKQ
jgi:hypothetical protein